MESKKTNRILSLITCGVLAATTALTAIFVGAGCKKTDDKAEVPIIPVEDEILDENGNDIKGDDFRAMPMNMVFAPHAANPSDVDTEEKMQANVTATITPSDAANKLVDWTVAFKSPSSTWASGKSVADYVTVTPTSDGSLSAKITCKQAFGEQILVTVTSRDNVDAKATCTLDYKQKFLGFGLDVVGINTVSADYTVSAFASALKVNLESGIQTSFVVKYKKSTVYTIARTDEECGKVGSIEIKTSTALSNALKGVKDGAQTITVASNAANIFNKAWVNGLSLTPAQINSVIAALKANKTNALTVTLKNSSGGIFATWDLTLDTSDVGNIKVVGISLDQSTVTFE